MEVNKQKQSWNDNFQEFMTKPVEKKQKKEEQSEKEEKQEKEEQTVSETRLFIMNLSYEVTNDELQNLFSKYGLIDRIEIPLRKGGKGQAMGIAYISFKEVEGAVSAFASLDKTFF